MWQVAVTEAIVGLDAVQDTPVPNLDEPQPQSVPQNVTSPSSSGQHLAEDHHISNLELENKLLRKEVASLNEEMVSVVQRAKEAERSMC